MISLPVKKIERNQQEAIHLLKEALSIWKIAALIGITYAARQAITIAPLFHCQLQALVNIVPPLADSPEAMKQKYHIQVDLTTEAREDLVWWSQKGTSYNAAPIRVPSPNIVIDVYHLGWGESCLRWDENRQYHKT